MAKFKFVFLFTFIVLINTLVTASVIRGENDISYDDWLKKAEEIIGRIDTIITEYDIEKNKLIESYYTKEQGSEHDKNIEKIDETLPPNSKAKECITEAEKEKTDVTDKYNKCETIGDDSKIIDELSKEKKLVRELIDTIKTKFEECSTDNKPNEECIQNIIKNYNPTVTAKNGAVDILIGKVDDLYSNMETCYKELGTFDKKSLEIITSLKTCVKTFDYNQLLSKANNIIKTIESLESYLKDQYAGKKDKLIKSYYTEEQGSTHDQTINSIDKDVPSDSKAKECITQAKKEKTDVTDKYNDCNTIGDDSKIKNQLNEKKELVKGLINTIKNEFEKCPTDDTNEECIERIITKYDSKVTTENEAVNTLKETVDNLYSNMEKCYTKLDKFLDKSPEIIKTLNTCVKTFDYNQLLSKANNIIKTIESLESYLKDKYAGKKDKLIKSYYTEEQGSTHDQTINSIDKDVPSDSKAKECINQAKKEKTDVTDKYNECNTIGDDSKIKNQLNEKKELVKGLINTIKNEFEKCPTDDTNEECIERIITKYDPKVTTENEAVNTLKETVDNLYSNMEKCYTKLNKFLDKSPEIIETLNTCVKTVVINLNTKCDSIIKFINDEKKYLKDTFTKKQNEIIKTSDDGINKHNKNMEDNKKDIDSKTNGILCPWRALYQTSLNMHEIQKLISESNSNNNIANVYILMSEKLITPISENIKKCVETSTNDCILESLKNEKYIVQVETNIATQSFKTNLENLDANLKLVNTNFDLVIKDFKDCKGALNKGEADKNIETTKTAVENLQHISEAINSIEGYTGEINSILEQFDISKTVQELESTISEKKKDVKSDAASTCITDALDETKEAKKKSETEQPKCVTTTKKSHDNNIKALTTVKKNVQSEITIENKCFTEESSAKLVTCLQNLNSGKIVSSNNDVQKVLTDANKNSEDFKSCLKSSINKDSIIDKLEKCIKEKNSASNIYANSILYFCSALLLLIRMI